MHPVLHDCRATFALPSPERPNSLCARFKRTRRMRFFPQSAHLDAAATERGMRMLMRDTIFFQMMTVLTSGVILTDFARGLAPESDTLIGLLAATPPLCLMLQVPTIALVERLRNRRAITVIAATTGRLAWFAPPFIAMMKDKTAAATLLVATQFWYHGGTYIAGCAISSWIRDLVPEHRISAYFGKRLATSTTASALTLLAVWLLLPDKSAAPEARVNALSACFVFGGVFGLISSSFIARAPEPEPPRGAHTPLLALLREPLADAGYRRFLMFNAVWFAIYGMTWQFFPKVLLARFGMSLPEVTALTMGGLLLNALFFRLWGRVAQKRDDRALLTGALPLYLLGLALWPAAELAPANFAAPIAVGAFILCGVAFAGMQLGVVNSGLKFAPRGKAAAYIACNALVMGAASAVSPALGGVLADLLDGKGRFAGMPHVNLPVSGLTVVFIIAILLGFHAIRRLELVPAARAHDRRDIYGDVFTEAVAVATAAGGMFAPRRLSALPFIGRDKDASKDNDGNR